MKSPNGYDWCTKCGRLMRVFYNGSCMQYTCADGCDEKDIERYRDRVRDKVLRERRHNELIVSGGTGI